MVFWVALLMCLGILCSAIRDLFLLAVLLLCEDFLLFVEDLLSLSGVIEAQWRLSRDFGFWFWIPFFLLTVSFFNCGMILQYLENHQHYYL